MPTTLTNGIQLPDKGSVDWYSSIQSNYNLIDTHLGDTDIHVTAEDKANWNSKQGSLSQSQLDAIAQVATNTNDIATLQTDKADTSHTHSSSDITDIEDYATKQYVDNSISDLVDNAPDALNTLNELSAALNDDSNFATTVTNALASKADSADLASVATSGSYDDLSDKPTINDSTITIQKNGSTVDSFTTNGSDKTINIPVPTKTSDLTNDSDFVVSSSLAAVATSGFYNDLDNKPTIPSKISDLIDDSNFVDISNPAVSSGITSAKVTDYDTHIADTDIHVTTADKTSWNTVTSKANDSDVVHKSGDETVGGVKTFSDLQIVSYGTQYKGSRNAYILPEFSAGYSGLAITTLGFLQTLKIGNFVLDANNKPTLDTSKAYIQIATGENNNVNTCVLEPRNSISSSLGTSANKWSKIYGTEYYYGSNNVEFSTKFVTTDTAQTVSGVKTFSDNPLIGNNNTNITISNRQITANSSYSAPTGSSYSFMQLKAIVNYVDSSPSIDATVVLSAQENAYSDGKRAGFNPNSNNTINLGLAGKRWANVYATNYYYGNDNVEFSTKFVTTDTAQIVSGVKTFSDNLTIYNSDDTVTPKGLIIRNAQWSMGESGGVTVSNINFLDKNSSVPASVMASKGISGQSYLRFAVRTKDSQNTTYSEEIYYDIDTSGNVEFRSWHDNIISLGTSAYKWKDVQTYKVNNLEPSSLSLPSGNISDVIDISSYITHLDGTSNSYTVPANGWISISVIGTAIDIVSSSWSDSRLRASSGNVRMLYPVLKNETVDISVIGTTLTYARFIPCQGNV